MSKLLASANSKEELLNYINEYYYSNNYIITEDNKIYNTKNFKTIDNIKVVFKNKRWRLERI